PHRHHKPVRRDRRGAVPRTFGVVRPLEQLVERRRLAIDQRRVAPHLGGELEEPQRAARGEQQAGAHQEEGHAAGARRRRGNGGSAGAAARAALTNPSSKSRERVSPTAARKSPVRGTSIPRKGGTIWVPGLGSR